MAGRAQGEGRGGGPDRRGRLGAAASRAGLAGLVEGASWWCPRVVGCRRGSRWAAQHIRSLHVSSLQRRMHRRVHSVCVPHCAALYRTAGAPMEIAEDLLTTFNISLVVTGTVHETCSRDSERQRYAVPQERGIFQ